MDIVFKNVDPSQVNTQTLASLGRFLSNRLHDFMCIIDILPIVETYFFTFKNLSNDDVAYFITQLFSEVSIRSVSQPSRKKIFSILDHILHNFPKRNQNFAKI